ncbi:MAG: hypothetical protein COS14_13835 [Bacteroidetes bacterium CG02_land_8_20_14_3_00_31_25]|nr:MAG: hypothetical protein COS14_13835 [Bacteroidetes bacterium CG02_land_8_20_14_3_00_31_25]PIY02772.1 MAG: hypothetical protein COZ21_12430 [Bacteroidetes bacterium CG_4_10_14_3_um_filter_31_20]
MKNLALRITLNSKVCNGKPTIRNMRFTVTQLLELLASGMKEKDILNDYPYIEKEDIEACYWYASRIANTKNVLYQ